MNAQRRSRPRRLRLAARVRRAPRARPPRRGPAADVDAAPAPGMVEPRKVAPHGPDQPREHARAASPRPPDPGRRPAHPRGGCRDDPRRRLAAATAATAVRPGPQRRARVRSRTATCCRTTPRPASRPPLIKGPEDDRDPRVSPDGTRILFDRESSPGPSAINSMVSDIDGRNARSAHGRRSPTWTRSPGHPTRSTSSMSSDADAVPAARSGIVERSTAPRHRARTTRPDTRPSRTCSGVPTPDGLIFRGDGGRGSTYGLYAVHRRRDGRAPDRRPSRRLSRATVSNAVLSPDGDTVAYHRRGRKPGSIVVDVDTGRERPIVIDGADGSHANPGLVAGRRDRSCSSASYGIDTVHLVVVPVDGRARSSRPARPSSPRAVDVSVRVLRPRTARIVASVTTPDGSTWLLDPAGGAGTRVDPGRARRSRAGSAPRPDRS